MASRRKHAASDSGRAPDAPDYDRFLASVAGVVSDGRRSAARSINQIMTATYWLIGRSLVDAERRGAVRSSDGPAALERLAADLTRRFGRAFSPQALQQMRQFYLEYPEGGTREPSSRPSDPRARRPRPAR